MKNIFRILDVFINWVVIIVLPLTILLGILDTYDAFANPEKYRHVQYQVDWMAEGFWRYIFKNVAFIVVGIVFWLSSSYKLRNKGLIWKRVYYSIWLFVLAAAIYNSFLVS